MALKKSPIFQEENSMSDESCEENVHVHMSKTAAQGTMFP
jgi:hypothetical protein